MHCPFKMDIFPRALQLLEILRLTVPCEGGGRLLEVRGTYPCPPRPRPFPSDTNFSGEAVAAGVTQDSSKGSDIIGSSFCDKFKGGYSSPEESFSRGFCKFAIEGS